MSRVPSSSRILQPLLLSRIALLTGGDGWYVRDLVRAATLLGHQAEAIDFCRVLPSAV